jgi:hypothetical protein
MKRVKLLLAATGTTVLLGALVSSASARNFSISNQDISAMWSEVSFEGAFGGRSGCHLTLEGSMHSRTSAKVAGSLVGYITRAILGRCEVGTGTILQERLPWHLRYSGFQGALPNITSSIVHIIGASFSIRTPEAVICHILTTAAQPGIGTFHRSTATHEITEAGIFGRIRSGEECLGSEGTLNSESGAVSLLGTSNVRISVTLI